MAKWKKVPHVLVATKTLAANEEDNVNVQTSSHVYMIRGILASSTGAFNLQITPTDTNKKLFSTACPHVLCTGQVFASGATGPFRIDGGEGDRYPSPLRVEKATTIVITLKDTSGAGNTINIALIGFRWERG